MVTELIRTLNDKIFLSSAGEIHLKLVHFEGFPPFRERFEIKVETSQRSFHPYNVYPREVKVPRCFQQIVARLIAEKEYRHFAKSKRFN